MEIFTLDENFRRKDVIDKYSSVIWTERYSSPGDIKIEVDPSKEMISKLSEGTFIGLKGSQEVMIIDTQSIENGRMTVSGSSLLEFLNQRMVYVNILGSAVNHLSLFLKTGTPAANIAWIIEHMFIDSYIPNDRMAKVTIGEVYGGGDVINNLEIPYAPILDAIKPIADTYALGLSLYLDHPANLEDGIDYGLKFRVYKGEDLTFPTGPNFVRFSPDDDSLTKVKELKSILEYKTVAYAYANNEPNVLHISTIEAYPGSNFLGEFARRSLFLFFDDLTLASMGAVDPSSPTPEETADFISMMDERAKKILAEHNHTQVVDGEVVPQNQFKYGVHYNLGDVVELRGYSEIGQKARITEYIRVKDASGERTYPTVSLID